METPTCDLLTSFSVPCFVLILETQRKPYHPARPRARERWKGRGVEAVPVFVTARERATAVGEVET